MLPERLANDPRLLPFRGEIAAETLHGRVRAPRYVTGLRRQVCVGAASLRKSHDAGAEQVNQALRGEGFIQYDEQEGWAWGQLETDHYVGWVRADELGEPVEATHRVSVLRTFIYEQPDMKSPVKQAVSMNARLALGAAQGNFLKVQDAGWVFARHVGLLADLEQDFVAVAERFVGSPYLWAGRESAGIDCSGLVQVSLQATGVYPLRDSDMQEQTIGEPLAPASDFSNLRRGDLVFWRGHVGIMSDAKTLLHASARDMKVEIEPLAEAVARIRPIAGEVRSVRRL
jgi:cell wall-associated NlpC family hydrolase